MQLRKTLIAVIALVISSVAADAQGTRAPSQREVRLYARLLAMTDTRTYDAALVDSVMRSSWTPLRAAGALAIGQVGSPVGSPGTPRLRELLQDANISVASNAAYALGLLVDSMSVPALRRALDGRPAVAREAAWALGEIGAPARSAILYGLADVSREDALQIQLLLAAAKLRPIPVAEIRPHLRQGTKPSVQWAASYAIARFRAPAGVRDLVSLARQMSSAEGASGPRATRPAGTADVYVFHSSGRQRARAEIARGLARSAAGDSLADSAIAVLTTLATDPHPHVRINAVRSLATYEARGRNAVVRATADADANVRIAAAQAIGTVLDSTVSSWSPVWERDTSFTFRSSILASAARAGAKLPQLVGWSSHNDWRYRAAALGAAAASDSITSRAAARSMLRDRDGRVRASAYGIIAGNDTTAPPRAIHDALLGGLKDPDFYARATVLGNLSRHPVIEDVPAVLEAYTLSLADSGNDARIAAIQYLSRAWRKDSARFSPDLRRRIVDLSPSDDPLVRAPADSISIMRAWHSTRGNPRPLSWYQNIVRTYVVPAVRGQTQRATMRTRRGDITLELFGADAPITVWNFMNLARSGYYRGTGFHRVVPNFVAQDGDPRDDGNGGPGYAIRDEMNPRRYERGALGMALSGPDTGGSQYFITHSPQPHLDGHYTVFGRVLSGYPALDAIVQGDRILSITVR